VSQKFAPKVEVRNAGPSTPFGAKNAPKLAQDDNAILEGQKLKART
jgi:hypothetical protein